MKGPVHGGHARSTTLPPILICLHILHLLVFSSSRVSLDPGFPFVSRALSTAVSCCCSIRVFPSIKSTIHSTPRMHPAAFFHLLLPSSLGMQFPVASGLGQRHLHPDTDAPARAVRSATGEMATDHGKWPRRDSSTYSQGGGLRAFALCVQQSRRRRLISPSAAPATGCSSRAHPANGMSLSGKWRYSQPCIWGIS